MKIISLTVLFALVFTVTCIPSEQQVEEKINIPAIINQVLASNVIPSSVMSAIQQFMASHPQLNNILTQQLTALGVQLPRGFDFGAFLESLAAQVLPTLLPSLISLIGKRDVEQKLNLQQILSSSIFQNIHQQIQGFLATHPQLNNLLTQQLLALGVVLPRGFNFGNFLESVLQTVVTTALPILAGAITGKRDVDQRINIQQILSSPIVQQLIQKVQAFLASNPNAINILKQFAQKLQAYLAANPQVYQFINQQLAVFGVQLPRIDIDWGQLGQTLLNNILPVVLPSLLGLIGKRDVEKLNFNQILSSPNVQQVCANIQQFLANNPKILQLAKQFAKEAHQFLAANPQVFQFIGQQLSVLGIQMPSLERIDWGAIGNSLLNQLPQLILPVLGSLIGKRDAEKLNLQLVLSSTQFQQISQNVMQFISANPSIMQLAIKFAKEVQQFLAANPQVFLFINQQLSVLGIQLPRLDLNINWEQLGQTLLNNVLPALLPSLLTLIGK